MIALVNSPQYGNRILYLSLAASFLFLLFIVRLVQKRRLTERFALAWMMIPLLLIFFSSNRALLEKLAAWAGIYYAPALMIPILFGLFILVSLYFSVKASKAENQIKRLTQELGLLKKGLERTRPRKKKTR
jgi:hypothetical protein